MKQTGSLLPGVELPNKRPAVEHIRTLVLFSSGAGTSGGEEGSWQPPDQELIQKLVAQIEYYLSDENLEHDAFLLKHVRRNKLGFVSVKLLTSFKKVRSFRSVSRAS